MRFLLLQHLASEDPGLIAESLRAAHHELKIIELWRQSPESDLSEWDGLIIMGGPASANDTHLPSITSSLDLIRTAIQCNTPMLGICLGAQLMAKAAGGVILKSPIRELGWYPVYPTRQASDDDIFSSIPSSGLRVFQWHGETFSLPDSATLLASNPDVPNQAFRLSQRQYGLQFHVEIDPDMVEAWISEGAGEREFLGTNGLLTLRTETAEYLQDMQRFGAGMMRSWLEEIHRFHA
ncbi:MAG TPA: type 1 glutamine amidotransferase [Mariprofundaceae bacterium]|nr:type 1 glutamine amidotransferase [Mariprofundaceae bacterium]